MKKSENMKKRVSFALVLSMLVSMLTFCNVMAFAAADPLTYEYDDSTMTATVTECDESATTVSIPKTVTKSGKKYTVTAIGYQAFYWMKSLKSVTIPDSVEIIGPEAFMNSSLASVNIPDSVTIIDDCAFFGCSSLTSIAIPDSVEIIGRQAFAFSSFANVNIPASVTYMADSAFDGDLLSNITVDANNKFYSSQQGVLFNKDKTELISYPSGKTETSYNIPASVKIIRAGAFGGCTSLTKVTIPNSVTTIEDDAFRGCTSLKSITLSNSITSIGGGAFNDTAYYNNSNNWQNDVLYINSALIKADVSLKQNYTIKEGCTVIADYAFEDCESVTGIKFPNSAKNIGFRAFGNCSTLKSVILPDSVETIDDNAFIFCDSLASITIHDTVTYIGDSAFSYTAYYNNSDNWQNNVLYINNILIEANESLNKEYKIKDGCTVIAAGAFDYSKASSITVADSVKIICGNGALNGDNLTNITVGSKNKFYSSQQGVLFNKDKTELISYPCGKTETSYNIPASVKIIRPGAFGGCTSLTKVTIPDSVITIGGFGGCSSLKSITIPNSVTTIGVSAFFGCSSLTSIAIPNSVTTIEKYAFTECTSLKSISVPKSVKYIGERAFFICNSLSDVYYEGSKSDRGLISVLPNEYGYISYKFVNATWHYNTYPEPEVIIKDTSKIFNDIPKSAWYKQYIDYAYTYGIFGGKSANTFEPDANITRAEFVQVLANLTGVDTSNKKVTTKFKDVKSGNWFAPAVKWANEKGIVSGKSATSFDPNAKISREEMCVMLINYAKFKGIALKKKETKINFADDYKISSWAKDRVYQCQMADIVNGKGGNKFDPSGTAKRCEAATIFKLFHEQYLR
ncbi:MAG: leucine-rich repeat protein [Clostridia bacterium]|nr:leucine-rich repeat protein [Clostridia bacterium]